MTFVESPASTRYLATCKAAGRPLPAFSADDALDYMVMEALVLKLGEEEQEARKKAADEAERERFRKGHRKMGRN